jgi:DNA-directed RNA polymerase subunit N (RpoN/RPB10)
VTQETLPETKQEALGKLTLDVQIALLQADGEVPKELPGDCTIVYAGRLIADKYCCFLFQDPNSGHRTECIDDLGIKQFCHKCYI